jgi:hypothetical protein
VCSNSLTVYSCSIRYPLVANIKSIVKNSNDHHVGTKDSTSKFGEANLDCVLIVQ